MSKARTKIPGTKKKRSYRIPLCPRHRVPAQRDLKDGWFCPSCANERLQRQADDVPRSQGGVHLPAGVKDARRVADFRDILPNHAARRRARRSY